MTGGARWLARVAAVVPLALVAASERAGQEPLADDATLVTLAVALSSADDPEAGRADAAAGTAGPAEVELVATIRVKALRFEDVPSVESVLRLGARRPAWRTERINLPARPEAGVVYRDVEVRLTVAGDLDAVTALLAEARRASGGVRLTGAEPITSGPGAGTP
jgi:hypothetical protein